MDELASMEDDLQRFKEDEFVADALAKGLDLRSYAKQISSDLAAAQAAAVPEFVEEAPVSASLFHALSACDEALEGMEKVLQGFQSDLGGISEEIRHLQEESLLMSVKLKNRRAVETELHQILDKLVVPEALVERICDGEVDEDYVLYVEELDNKIRFVKSKESLLIPNEGGQTEESGTIPSGMQAVQEVEPQLMKLKLKASSKIRHFLLNQMAGLKKPKTNVQMLQTNVLLKYRYFVTFFAEHSPDVAEEIRSTYVDTMSKVLYTQFKAYWVGLLKMLIPGPGKEDLIAADQAIIEQQEKNPASLYGSFSLAEREKRLGEPEAPPIIVHVAKASSAKFFFEGLFRSVQKHLMDSASSEFLFILEFFDGKTSELFDQIFARTISLFHEHIENFLFTNHDPVSLLLMIRTTQSHRLIMERRRVPSLDKYLDQVNMMLWPEFKKIFDANLSSIRSPNLQKLRAQALDLKPHYVSSRFARFTSVIHALSISLHASDEMLPHHLTNLRQSYLELLQKLVEAALQSKNYHRVLASEKGKLTFRINNLDAVLSYFSTAGHAVNAEDVSAFEEQLEGDVASYIELELAQTMPAFIKAIKEESQPVEVVQEFTSNWKAYLSQLNDAISNHFSNPDNAREILKSTFSQFLIYLTRFRECPAGNTDIVSVQIVMQEMKKFSK